MAKFQNIWDYGPEKDDWGDTGRTQISMIDVGFEPPSRGYSEDA
jgi:hypothetical protein